MFKMSIGENLKKVRDEFGFSREELAALADVTPWVIRTAEEDINAPRLDFIIKIADALGLTIDEVVGHYVEDPKY